MHVDRARHHADGGRALRVRHHDHFLDRRQRGDDLGEARHDVDRLAVVEIAVGAEEYAWLDLAEAVEHALHAEIRRARRPDRADARRRKHRDYGARDVGHVGRDAVSGLDAARAQRLREPRDLVMRARRTSRCQHTRVLAPEYDRCLAVAPAQQVFGEIQARLREPTRTRHAVAVLDDDIAPALGDDAAEFPQQAVVFCRLADRPCVQRGVIGKG